MLPEGALRESGDYMSQTAEAAEKKVDLGFDPNQLREKYRQERDKRLRDDGNDQYIEVKGDFANYIDDPYVDPGFDREPLNDEVEVVVVGGGFGGLIAGARLREAGIHDIRMIEKGGDFGGTWYWNRYPGAACDVESYVYLPLLEETGYLPREKYSRADEIAEHSRRIARHYNLYDNACLQTEVTEVRWDDDAARWTIRTNRGDEMKARFLVMSNGPLNRPKLPGIKGIDRFKGHTFHTSRWDYDYTGGDADGNLTGLKDKRVAIIGTGATAVQCVPHLGASAKQLYVFQRTPSSIDIRNNRPTDPEWAETLEPGWQRERMDNFNTLVSGGVAAQDLVNDGWTDIIRNILLLAHQSDNALSPDKIEETVELADFKKMEQVRGRVDEVVRNAETADALKPWYRQFCKRPCFHDEYLDTFNRDNVSLIDTNGRGVEEIVAHAIIANGKIYEVDCIIFATGFEVGTSYARRCGYEIYGRGGKTLTEAWDNGVATLHGMHVNQFPNAFILAGPQGAFTVNYPHNLEQQSTHVAWIIAEAMARQARTVEATEEAVAGWVQTCIDKAVQRLKFFEECTPGYYNNEGRPGERRGQDGFYGGSPVEYFQMLADQRANDDLHGLVLN